MIFCCTICLSTRYLRSSFFLPRLIFSLSLEIQSSYWSGRQLFCQKISPPLGPYEFPRKTSKILRIGDFPHRIFRGDPVLLRAFLLSVSLSLSLSLALSDEALSASWSLFLFSLSLSISFSLTHQLQSAPSSSSISTALSGLQCTPYLGLSPSLQTHGVRREQS